MLKDHLEKLNNFVGVAKAGSIRKYATICNLSQPAVSKSLQNLEAELEASLLIRDVHGIELTAAGRKLFAWAETVLNEADEIAHKIRNEAGLRFRGELTIGTYSSIAVYFMPKFFKFIQTTQSGLTLSFASGSSRELVRQLRSGSLDLIISIDPPKDAEFFQLDLFEDFYSLYRVSGSAHTAKTASIFTLTAAEDRSGKTIKSYLKKTALFSRVVPCNDFEAVKAMLEADVGWAILPDRVAASGLAAKRIERVEKLAQLQRFGSHSIVFSCRKHRAEDAAIRWIADQLRGMLAKETRG